MKAFTRGTSSSSARWSGFWENFYLCKTTDNINYAPIRGFAESPSAKLFFAEAWTTIVPTSMKGEANPNFLGQGNNDLTRSLRTNNQLTITKLLD